MIKRFLGGFSALGFLLLKPGKAEVRIIASDRLAKGMSVEDYEGRLLAFSKPSGGRH